MKGEVYEKLDFDLLTSVMLNRAEKIDEFYTSIEDEKLKEHLKKEHERRLNIGKKHKKT